MKTAKELFKGIEIYEDEAVVLANRFTGEKITVTGEEASVYEIGRAHV